MLLYIDGLCILFLTHFDSVFHSVPRTFMCFGAKEHAAL